MIRIGKEKGIKKRTKYYDDAYEACSFLAALVFCKVDAEITKCTSEEGVEGVLFTYYTTDSVEEDVLKTHKIHLEMTK
jgi:hypothetical protein